MLKYAIVGIAGMLAGGLATWALRPTPEGREGHGTERTRTVREPRTVTHDEPVEDTDFAECRRALVQQRAELRLVREEAARGTAERLLDEEDGVAPSAPSASSPHPSVGDANQGGDAQPSERERSRAASERVRETVVEHLGVTEDEQQVIKDLVCTQRDNVRGLYTELGEGRMDADAFVQALAQERTLTSEGLRRSLGSRRYRRFRELGAIGLLTPQLCKKQR